MVGIDGGLQYLELEEDAEPVRMDGRSAAITEMVELVDSTLGQRGEPEGEYSRGFRDGLEFVRNELLASYGSGEVENL